LIYEHMFCSMTDVTADPRPYARFRKALEVRSVMQVEAAARELGRLSLLDAIDYCLLLASEAPERYERAARRLLVRLVTERDSLGLDEAQLAIACLRGLVGADRDRLADVLRVLAGGRQRSNGGWR
jgi:hypothetical protein